MKPIAGVLNKLRSAADSARRRLTPRGRLLAGSVAMLVIVLAIAAVGLVAFSAMRRSARNATTVGGRLHAIGLEIQLHNLETQRRVEQCSSQLEDPALREDAVSALKEAVFEAGEVEELSAEAVKLAQGTEAQGAFTRLATAVGRYHRAVEAFTDAAGSGSPQKVLDLAVTNYLDSAGELDRSGEDAETAGEQASIDSAEEVERTGQRASLAASVISVGGIALLLVLSYSIWNLLREHMRMGTELDIARRLQRMLLPCEAEVRRIGLMDISGCTEPATEVGGDYFDVINNDDNVIFSIGDVTGHGLESGVIAIMTQTAIRTLNAAGVTESRRMIEVLNRVLYENVRQMGCDRNLTLSLLRCGNNSVTISGQHEEVLLVRSNGELERHDTIELGFPLGLEKNISGWVGETRIPIAAGDVLVLYTDGITEATNRAGAMFGMERLCETLQRHREETSEGIRDAVMAAVRTFMGGAPATDDISLLVIKPA